MRKIGDLGLDSVPVFKRQRHKDIMRRRIIYVMTQYTRIVVQVLIDGNDADIKVLVSIFGKPYFLISNV